MWALEVIAMRMQQDLRAHGHSERGVEITVQEPSSEAREMLEYLDNIPTTVRKPGKEAANDVVEESGKLLKESQDRLRRFWGCNLQSDG